MATKLYDLAVKVSEYQDRQTGETKGRYQNIGSVMKNDNGDVFMMLAKWFNPAGVPDFSGRNGDSLLVSMYKPQNQQNNQGGGQQQRQPAQQQRQAPAQQQQYTDDIPF